MQQSTPTGDAARPSHVAQPSSVRVSTSPSAFTVNASCSDADADPDALSGYRTADVDPQPRRLRHAVHVPASPGTCRPWAAPPASSPRARQGRTPTRSSGRPVVRRRRRAVRVRLDHPCLAPQQIVRRPRDRPPRVGHVTSLSRTGRRATAGGSCRKGADPYRAAALRVTQRLTDMARVADLVPIEARGTLCSNELRSCVAQCADCHVERHTPWRAIRTRVKFNL